MEQLKDKQHWLGHLALTNSGNKHSAKAFQNQHKWLDLRWTQLSIGRINFKEKLNSLNQIVNNNSSKKLKFQVFCQGSGGLQNVVESACKSLTNMHYST